MVKRRKFTPEYKARIVLEILTEGKSIAEASREYGIKASVLSYGLCTAFDPRLRT